MDDRHFSESADHEEIRESLERKGLTDTLVLHSL